MNASTLLSLAERVEKASGRVRVILDCEWGDLQHALDMVIAARPAFDRSCRGPGWGWNYGTPEKPALFVRRTKRGYSATAYPRDSDSGPQGENSRSEVEGEAPQSGDGDKPAHRPTSSSQTIDIGGEG